MGGASTRLKRAQWSRTSGDKAGFDMAFDSILRNATLPDGRKGQDVAIADGRIVAVEPRIEAEAAWTIDARGHLLAPPFVDCHFHLDATLSLGLPRLNNSGTLLEGIALWSELKPLLTHEAVTERALRYCDLAVSQGLLAIRSHVDVCDDRLLAVEALLDVKKRVKPYLDLQLVAFPQDGYFRSPGAARNLERALDLGVDVVGGIPHFERTMADGAASVRALCEIAARRGLMVDLHCDESDDPMSRHVETLAYEAQRLGLGARATGSHLTSMHSMDNYYVSKLLPLIAESGICAISNPLINLTLQGRHDAYPKRRGITRVAEMRAHSGRARAGLRDGPLVQPRRRRHARCCAYGRPRRANDESRGHPLDFRRGDGNPGANTGARRLRPRRRGPRRYGAAASGRSNRSGAAARDPAYCHAPRQDYCSHARADERAFAQRKAHQPRSGLLRAASGRLD